jgi:hypothetical protein
LLGGLGACGFLLGQPGGLFGLPGCVAGLVPGGLCGADQLVGLGGALLGGGRAGFGDRGGGCP